MYEKDVKQFTISQHINNIFKEGELEKKILSEIPIKVQQNNYIVK